MYPVEIQYVREQRSPASITWAALPKIGHYRLGAKCRNCHLSPDLPGQDFARLISLLGGVSDLDTVILISMIGNTLEPLMSTSGTPPSVSLLVTAALLVSSQLFQQRLGFLQMLRVKPFGEPAINGVERTKVQKVS
jgi:hypothetical protein